MTDAAGPNLLGSTTVGAYGTRDDAALARAEDALLEAVSAGYGGRLTEAQSAEVRARIHHHLNVAERLHRYPLTNADEPAFGFTAYDGER